MNNNFWSLNKIIIAIGLTIFIFLFSFAIFNKKGILRTFEVNRTLENIKGNISHLETENQQLKETIQSHKSEDFQTEKIAREGLGLAQKKEIIIKIIK